jgi:hypothetical protein
LEFWKFWGFSKPNEKNPNFLVFQSRQRGRAEGSQGWPVNPSIMQSYAHFLGILCTGSGGFLGIIYAWIAISRKVRNTKISLLLNHNITITQHNLFFKKIYTILEEKLESILKQF